MWNVIFFTLQVGTFNYAKKDDLIVWASFVPILQTHLKLIVIIYSVIMESHS